ncbi:MAG TPA: HDIG domain-containing protein, partial [Gemmatimonadales bacterium]|nr:HDIG domain-containing protein [Gemmatimonadales bacterium]
DSAAALAQARSLGVRLSAEEATYLLERIPVFRTATARFFARELGRGVPASGAMEFELSREVVVRRRGTERVVARDSVLTFQGLLSRRETGHPAPNSVLGDQVYVKLLHGLFRPSLVADAQATEALRAELRASVDSVKSTVQANQRIVAAHEVVTPEIYQRLMALRGELVREGRSEASPAGMAGQVLTNALILSLLWLLLLVYRQSIYQDLRTMGAVALIVGACVAGAAANRAFLSDGPELIPISFAGMLVGMLISGRVALIAALVLAVLLGSQGVYGGATAVYVAAVGGAAGAISVRHVRRRSHLLWGALAVGLALAAALGTLGLRGAIPGDALPGALVRGGINAFVSAALAAITLPALEVFTGITTDMTLLELSDPARPLLRRLASEAPGTYAHSVAMANLCEAACNAVGANGLLARVGCYYHDIGKVRRPQYFVENQGPGASLHDKLKPEASATIIRNHVKDGLALAAEHRLPPAVRAFIPEHHGTSEITFFLDRARAVGAVTAGTESEDPYRYPGPRPRSVETAVALLADGVEAAVRVLEEPSQTRIAEAIDHLIQQRVTAGQLAEAPMTLAQLSQVRDIFVRVLSGMYHGRVNYPAATGGITAGWEAPARA